MITSSHKQKPLHTFIFHPPSDSAEWSLSPAFEILYFAYLPTLSWVSDIVPHLQANTLKQPLCPSELPARWQMAGGSQKHGVCAEPLNILISPNLRLPLNKSEPVVQTHSKTVRSVKYSELGTLKVLSGIIQFCSVKTLAILATLPQTPFRYSQPAGEGLCHRS